MTAITIQKMDLRVCIRDIVMNAYDAAPNSDERRGLTKALVIRYLQRATLKELKAWHHQLVINKLVIEKKEE